MVQVLISCMNKNVEIIEKMKISSDAIIINQSQSLKEDRKKFIHKNNIIDFITLNEVGVGRSRNTAILKANDNILLFADEDIVYYDNYQKIIEQEFNKKPNVDFLLFNLKILQDGKVRETVRKNQRVRLYNCLRYGAVCFAVRRKSLNKANVFFSLEFGGGAKYGSGEDSLFLWECLKKGLVVETVKKTIGEVHNDGSTWFTGYNKKYFYDKGALYRALSKSIFPVLIIQFVLRKQKKMFPNISKKEAIKWMLKGADEYNNRMSDC